MADQTEASPRKRELLAATLAYAAENNLSDLSLRPLAAAIGSSPRVLLYLFGSKEGLIREVLAAARAEQLALVARADEEGGAPRAVLEHLWEWVTDPEHRTILRLFFEGYIRSSGDPEGPWAGLAAASVQDWLPLFETLLADRPLPPTLVLAALRGLLLDLLADPGALPRVDAAWTALLDAAFGPGAGRQVRT
ncbi:TetR/AcrR family transcriptional regulator [Yinghuangia soli]|uniref:TetR/AcrR family transcriptional regulator n=1 Tax=Yinghuangia soli TaxID=2908204 RepID=A0AA41Q595_9ACTN|nr:TetR/AcrR family transcriptional regulator [Yinghuangia soli]MCF2530916.1 TetR/AcrR family transcriptional regulator [Yinghuangia soli]